MGFVKSQSVTIFYVKETSDNLIVVSIYVDDLLVTGSNEMLVGDFKFEILKVFEMKDLGLMSYFLGMKMKQRSNGILIHQRSYAKEILKKFRIEKMQSKDT